MCNCFSLAAAATSPGGGDVRAAAAAHAPGADQGGSGVTGVPAAGHIDQAELDALHRAGPWIDVHAHPGRCFLRGLPEGDGLVALLGRDDVTRATADLRAGRVAATSFATVADLRVLAVDERGLRAGREFELGEAWADHERQLDALVELGTSGQLRPILEPTDLRRSAPDDAPGMWLSCEGGDFLEGRVERLARVHARGVRSITLVHYRVNALGDIQTEAPRHGGLSDFGSQVVREMNRLGMVIDLAHATWETTRDALECSEQPVMISHSHLAAGKHAHPRLLGEEHALAVARAGGVVGAWPSGVALTSFDDFVDEVVRMVELLGAEHVAIGTDMDANYQPVMTSYREFPALALGLRERGLGREQTALVLGGSFARLFERVRSGAAGS